MAWMLRPPRLRGDDTLLGLRLYYGTTSTYYNLNSHTTVTVSFTYGLKIGLEC
jgi:hypothetical protein